MFKLVLGLIALFLLGVYLIGSQPDPFYFLRKRRTALVADPENLKRDVKWLSVDRFPRDYSSTESQRLIVEEIEKRFKSLGFEVSRQIVQTNDGTFENVIALRKGATPERIVVGAHYDTCDKHPGADDNASGVAGLLELARLISIKPTSTTVELVAYPNEEPPNFDTDGMGSFVHASQLRKEGVNVRGMISLEMIGYFSDDVGSQSYPMSLLRLFYPSRGNFIAVIGDLLNLKLVRTLKAGMSLSTDLPVVSLNGPTFIPGIRWSDHSSYWRMGFPAAMITDTAFFRNTAYHTSGDTWDRLDYARMGKVVSALHGALSEM